MNEILKNITISWLEGGKSSGVFEGQLEEDMDFRKLSDSDIVWYFENWVLENIDVEDFDDDERGEITQYIKDFC